MTSVGFSITGEGGKALTEDQLCMACSALTLEQAVTMLSLIGVDEHKLGPGACAVFTIKQVIEQLRGQSKANVTIVRTEGSGSCEHQQP